MLKYRTLHLIVGMLATIGLMVSAMLAYRVGSIIAEPYGNMTEGSYRNIQIGMDRWDVGRLLRKGGSKLKLVGFSGRNTAVCWIGLNDEDCGAISQSDTYAVRYEGWHYEMISIYFEQDRVAAIQFTRRIIYLDP